MGFFKIFMTSSVEVALPLLLSLVSLIAPWRHNSNNVFHTLTVAESVATTCHKNLEMLRKGVVVVG